MGGQCDPEPGNAARCVACHNVRRSAVELSTQTLTLEVFHLGVEHSVRRVCPRSASPQHIAHAGSSQLTSLGAAAI
jgi:hypothetical protein